jgi:hypothetical protein
MTVDRKYSASTPSALPSVYGPSNDDVGRDGANDEAALEIGSENAIEIG